MRKDKVEFNGKLYNLRLIDFGADWGNYFVASIQLERLLIEEDGGYTSEAARWVDEVIFYFIPTHYFKFSDEKLRNTILDEIG